MNNYGKVSIIMPAFKSEKLIGKSIKSVLAQTYSNWELLIDDGSPDEKTKEVVSSFDDPRIRYHKDDKNRGCAYSRNFALRSANGKWVAFLDSDDLWLPSKLQDQLAFMVINNYAFSYTTYFEVDEKEKPTGVLVFGPEHISNKTMKRYVYPGCLTCVYSSDVVGVIQVDERIGNGANDDALFLRASEKADCYLLNKPLALYRVSRNSSSHRGMLKNFQYQINFYRFDRGKTSFSAFFLALRKAFIYIFWKKPHYRKRVTNNAQFIN